MTAIESSSDELHDDRRHDDERHADQHRPLASYAVLTVIFNAGFGTALVAARERLPERIAARDLGMITIGTYKLSRLIARDRVTSGLRAPYTRFQGDAGPSEVDERARGSGPRRALGELLVCPYCVDQWVAAGYVSGMLFAPRVTRMVATMFAVVAGADVLQHGYRLMQEKA